MNLFLKFKNKLSKTSNFLSVNILETFKNKKVDTSTLEELESILISSDISLDVVDQLIDSVRKVNASNDKVINIVFAVRINKRPWKY